MGAHTPADWEPAALERAVLADGRRVWARLPALIAELEQVAIDMARCGYVVDDTPTAVLGLELYQAADRLALVRWRWVAAQLVDLAEQQAARAEAHAAIAAAQAVLGHPEREHPPAGAGGEE